jgi:hypothetical protein
MAVRETLLRILTDYPNAKAAPLEGNPLAQFIRGDAEAARASLARTTPASLPSPLANLH